MYKSRKKYWVSVLSAVLICASFTTPDLVNAQEAATRQKIIDQYQRAIDIIREKYVEPLDEEPLTTAALQGMLKTLDPHSDYLDPKSFKDFTEKQNSEYYGIGSYVRTINNGTYIVEPFKNSPASRAGLRYGDQIVFVDGKDTTKFRSDQVTELLLGERGTKVVVKVKRLGAQEPLTMTITRDGIWRPSIPNYYLIKPNIGYIGLTRGFQATTTQELRRAMADLRESGAESFILDLRDNGGGYVEQAVGVCDQFLQRGQTIVSVRRRGGRGGDRTAFAENGATENFPLVVMINRYSASASEIVAGAIQDHDRGLIVGETSFGKGLVQNVIPLTNGGGLILATAHYYTPSGRLIQRDYSKGSLFEYYNQRGVDGASKKTPSPTADVKKTDIGREVYGGGGIEPDVKLDGPPAVTPLQGRLYHAVDLFVRQLVSGQLQDYQQFKLNGITYDYKLKGDEYLVSDDLLKHYRDFAVKFYKEHPEYAVTAAMIDAELVWQRNRIRQEVLLAAYGSDRSQQGMSALDTQLQRAVSEMPKAADIAAR
ncbi:MAG TPA: S41 family peptidase, partial [Blastocatellia bacterium]|nr:S41 family peptidase [Blastocatellia bacterium]